MGLDATLTGSGWVVQPLTSSGGFLIEKITEAELPAASTSNMNTAYMLTDVGNKTVYNFDGVTWEDITPPLDAAASQYQASTWAARGTGDFVGHIKRFSNIGNNVNVMGVWDGTYWQPMGGRQLIYNSLAVVNGTNANPSVITLPTVVIPGGLMGIFGGFEVEIATSITDGTATTANTISYTFDGFELFGTDNTTSRRLWFARRVKNQGSASIQTVMSNASGSGAYAAAANDPKATTKVSTGDLTLAGTATATCGVAKVNRLDEFKVWWI